MNKKLNQYGSHYIDSTDIQSVVKVLKNGNLTAGPEVNLFERDFAKKVKSKYAISCSNGTSALHLALLSLGIGSGDIVIVPSITFVATFNSIIMTGANPIISDVDENNGLVCIEHVDQIIKKFKNRIKAIIVVHLNGNVVRVDKIRQKYKNLKIIEDSCHALGSHYNLKKTQYVGDCAFSDLSCFSFHPVKNITTGEGGMVTTNNQRLNKKLTLLRNHNLSRVNLKDKSFPYSIDNLGYNYRLTDIQCSLGRSQLKKLDVFKKSRRKLVERYVKNLENKSDYINFVNDYYSDSFWHLFVIKVDFKKIGKNRNIVIEKLNKEGIGSQIHYIPLFMHKYIKRDFAFSIIGKYGGSKNYFSKILSLPLHLNLKLKDIDYVCKKLINILEKK